MSEKLDSIALETREREELLVLFDTSSGLTINYNANGGRSGRTADITAMKAIMCASESTATKNARAWRGLVSRVYSSLLVQGRKTEFQCKRDRLLAWLLFHRVLMGRSIGQIAEREVYGEGRISLSCVYRYYSEIIDLCVVQAVKMGLIP